jgi:hypothetical protein
MIVIVTKFVLPKGCDYQSPYAGNSLGDYIIQINVESLTFVDSNYPVEDWWFFRLYRIYLSSISRKLKDTLSNLFLEPTSTEQ